mmetsp:Transcript_34723/g.75316  ORF Transcript_34723/g.75316 Transcript_34723/m.75316 type:complete len:120 (+) Transcript_34723:436-795(+)
MVLRGAATVMLQQRTCLNAAVPRKKRRHSRIRSMAGARILPPVLRRSPRRILFLVVLMAMSRRRLSRTFLYNGTRRELMSSQEDAFRMLAVVISRSLVRDKGEKSVHAQVFVRKNNRRL